ncbi:MAG: hypothetical protein OXB89_05870 [Anaerolineaceae bacterium]|nr:hypothetical protein [Anaerolineaceae bacterium]
MTIPKFTKVLLFAAAVCACVLLYLHIAGIQYEVNQHMGSIDQSAYMDFARKAHETRLHYTGGRARMPLFPWILALFYSEDMTDQEFFEAGKQLNVWLSIVALLALGTAFFVRFSRLYASYAILSIAFLVFVLKSPVFQPEMLYYSLFGCAFMLAISNLSAPTLRKSLALGLLFGLAHFAKASVLPAMVIYIGSFGVLVVVRLLRDKAGRQQALTNGMYALLSLLAFLALLFPYLQESYEKYGSHFYDVSTTFYIWYDGWGEAKAGTRAAGDREGYPDLPPEEIPTLEKYIREHSLQEIFGRFRSGLKWLYELSCILDHTPSQFNSAGDGPGGRLGYCSQVSAGLLLMAASLPLLLRRREWRGLLDMGHIIFFVSMIFVVYTMGAAWYIPIGGTSTRQFLVLAVPFFWTLGLIIHSRPVQELRLRLDNHSFRVFHLTFGLLSLILLDEILLVLTERAATVYGPK